MIKQKEHISNEQKKKESEKKFMMTFISHRTELEISAIIFFGLLT